MNFPFRISLLLIFNRPIAIFPMPILPIKW